MNVAGWFERVSRLNMVEWAALQQLVRDARGITDRNMRWKAAPGLIRKGLAFVDEDGRNHATFYGHCAVIYMKNGRFLDIGARLGN